MRLSRVRFTVRGLMIAVAFTPVVLFSGWVTRDFWPISSSIIEERPPSYGPDHSITWTVVEEQQFSAWPSLFSMALTTASLYACWAVVARWRRDSAAVGGKSEVEIESR